MMSRTTVAHDAPTAYNQTPRVITSPNGLRCGTVGTGKSADTKAGVARGMILAGRAFVVFDKKPDDKNPDQGEYAPLAEAFHAPTARFTVEGDGARFNALDPVMGDGSLAQRYELVKTIVGLARGGRVPDEWESRAIMSAMHTVSSVGLARTPTLADLLPVLGQVDGVENLSSGSRDRLHEAGVAVRFALEELVAMYPQVLDGETSPQLTADQKLTVFDVSQLPDEGAATPVVMAMAYMWLLGRIRRGVGVSRVVTSVVWEEGWHLVGGPSARLLQSTQKLSRSLGIANEFNMHKVSDIPESSPGYAVIQEAQTAMIFRQDRTTDAEAVVKIFGLAPETTDTIMTLGVGECVLYRAGYPEIQVQNVRSDWEIGFTDTDAALATAVRS